MYVACTNASERGTIEQPETFQKHKRACVSVVNSGPKDSGKEEAEWEKQRMLRDHKKNT